MKQESNNETRRQNGATEDRGGNVADSSGAIRSKDEGGSMKAEISFQFPAIGTKHRSGKEILSEAGQILRLIAKVEQLEAENAMLKDRLHRRMILDEKTIHAGAPVPDQATREPMLSFIGRDQFRDFGAGPAKRSFWSRFLSF